MGQANYQPRVTAPAQAQQPQTPQFGGQPAPSAGTPQAANWMQGRAGVSGATAPFLQPFATDEQAAYSSPLTRNYDARIANIRGQANAASGAYNQMGRPSAGSQFAQNQAAGYTTDQYGRQYQMTPQIAGTAPGQTGWVQGQSLGGAPHGIYVQGNLPRPEGGMGRVAAGQQGLRPSAFGGGASSAAIASMTGGIWRWIVGIRGDEVPPSADGRPADRRPRPHAGPRTEHSGRPGCDAEAGHADAWTGNAGWTASGSSRSRCPGSRTGQCP